jgi:hypothetical protein
MHFDPELPAGFQDADFEQREMEELGNAIARGRRAGICQHQSAVRNVINPATGKVFYPEQEGISGEQLRCTEGCGQVFENDGEWFEAREAARR